MPDEATTEESSSFALQVRDALAHLHDPGHLQRHPLTRYVRPDSARASNVGRTLRQDILDATEALRPAAGTTPGGRGSRT